MSLLLSSVVLGAMLPSAISGHEDKLWLMFFMKGEIASPSDKDASAKLMEGHFGNMRKQAALGKLFTAGPLKDPSGQRRGITVVQAHERKDVEGLFTEDPFVKAGIMKVAAAEWDISKDRFKPAIDPSKLATYSLVLVKRGKGMQPETAKMQADHQKAVKSLLKQFGPGLWGPASGLDNLREAAIVAGQDAEKIKQVFADDPLVRKAILEVEVLPLWMSAGIIK